MPLWRATLASSFREGAGSVRCVATSNPTRRWRISPGRAARSGERIGDDFCGAFRLFEIVPREFRLARETPATDLPT
jgi:hypothetical protein